jgi:hypothetical protein
MRFNPGDERGHEFRVERQDRQSGGRPLAYASLSPLPLTPGERDGLRGQRGIIELQQAGTPLNAVQRLPHTVPACPGRGDPAERRGLAVKHQRAQGEQFPGQDRGLRPRQCADGQQEEGLRRRLSERRRRETASGYQPGPAAVPGQRIENRIPS